MSLVAFDAFIYGLLLGGLYALFALGLTLIWGIGKVWDYAQAGILAVGGYLSWFLTTAFNLSWFFTLLICMAVGAVLSIIIERSLYNKVGKRTKERMIIAFGTCLVIENLLLVVFSAKLKTVTSPFEGIIIKTPLIWIPSYRLFIILLVFAIYVAFFFAVKYTLLGKALRATAQNPVGAEFVGINTKITYSLIFALGGALSGITGVLIAPIYGLQPNIGLIPIFKATIVMVLGGLGEPLGALIGGFIVGVAESFFGIYVSVPYFNTVAVMILLAVLVLRPYGIFGKKERYQR